MRRPARRFRYSTSWTVPLWPSDGPPMRFTSTGERLTIDQWHEYWRHRGAHLTLLWDGGSKEWRELRQKEMDRFWKPLPED